MSTNTTEFRLRNIEEFDADFVRNIRITKQSPVKPTEKTVPSLIPELDKTVFSVKAPTPPPADVAAPQTPADIPVSAQPVQPAQPAPRPLVPIGSGQTVIPPEQKRIGTDIPIQQNPININPDELQEDIPGVKKGSKKGALALKITSIILLSVTIIVFLIGCLISVFLNNNGTQLAGYCFNSQIRDTTFKTVDGKITISKGSLIVSKPIDAEDYETNMMISVLAKDESGNKYCDVYSVGTVSEINDDVVGFDLIEPDSGEIKGQSTSADCYGLIDFYIPVIGGALAFTLSSALNAVLVCALFILIAAFWFLLLILSEKKLKAFKENQ